MPVKRSASEESSDLNTNTSVTPSPSKKPKTSPKSPKSKYTEDEERRFLETINRIVKNSLWQEAKSDPILSKRGANGMQAHWLALYKKLSKGI
ncbi:hypothetical protein BCR39DRAFT_591671 [Naematelia encephala]|uniref:Myb-like domain-containing protein n=1 Tax=Naematelia encephala TaxID=71784 RepID=A0A1Y2AF72_9TREE|nr:hypothetical protein BCR39DRAFT_591671 [Naematelia encephala]